MEIATREAFGKKLAELGEKYPQIVVLDADLSCSTKTDIFAKKFPHRFFNMGVAEQDMMGTAAGLAACGKIVFTSTFAMFATGRAWEPVRQSIVYPHLNVKICASHAGLNVGEDGASHQIVEDISLMRTIPTMKVFVPSDAVETEKILEAIVLAPGPCYVRLNRAKSPVLFEPSYDFKIGKGNVIVQGKEVCFFTMGFMTHIVLDGVRILKDKGVHATVVNCASVKPLDEDLVVAMALRHKLLVSIEEHVIMGGLGSAIAETLTSRHPASLLRLGMNDEFGQSGSHQELLEHYGLSAPKIAEKVLARCRE
jgi:transketolase